MSLRAARLDLFRAFQAAMPAYVTVTAEPMARGHYTRIAALLFVRDVLPTIDDGTDMVSAEIILDVPSTPSTPGAWTMLDELVDRVDAAMPITWLALDDWDVTTIVEDSVQLLRATCTALGHPVEAAIGRILIGADGGGFIRAGDGAGVLLWRG